MKEYDKVKLAQGMHEYMKYGLVKFKADLDNGNLEVSEKSALKVWNETYSNIARYFVATYEYDNVAKEIIKEKLNDLTNKLK